MFCIYQILLQTGTLQLCDVSFGCEVPTVTKSKKKVSLSPASSLQRSADTNKSNLASLPPLPPLQTVESSLLPEIQPNYRPNRIPDLMDTPGKKHKGKNRSEEHTSELQSRQYLVCRLLLEKKKHCFIFSFLNFYHDFL